jgi:hypothetical protein
MKTFLFFFFLAIFVASILSRIYYLYDYRPSQIKVACHWQALENAEQLMRTKVELNPHEYKKGAGRLMHFKADFDSYYGDCLTENGLEK